MIKKKDKFRKKLLKFIENIGLNVEDVNPDMVEKFVGKVCDKKNKTK